MRETNNTSADFGIHYIAQVTYRDGGITLHGPFDTKQEAADWLDDRAEFDYKDFVGEGEILSLNKIEPKKKLVKCHFCDEKHEPGGPMYAHAVKTHMVEINAAGYKLDPKTLESHA